MTTHDDLAQLQPRWNRLRSLLSKAAPTLPPPLRSDLDELRADLLEAAFGGPPLYDERRPDLDPSDLRLAIALDILAALSVAEPDDPSYPWERGGLLYTIGRHLEAADDFLSAADRFSRAFSAGTGLTGDEDEWASSALFHAAQNLLLGGQTLAAAALLPRLAANDRAEIAELVETARAPVATA